MRGISTYELGWLGSAMAWGGQVREPERPGGVVSIRPHRNPWICTMLALSVRQLFAWAIFHAGMDVENRDWATQQHGRVLIHAPANVLAAIWSIGYAKSSHVAASYPTKRILREEALWARWRSLIA
jgi:hypothetical protein